MCVTGCVAGYLTQTLLPVFQDMRWSVDSRQQYRGEIVEVEILTTRLRDDRIAIRVDMLVSIFRLLRPTVGEDHRVDRNMICSPAGWRSFRQLLSELDILGGDLYISRGVLWG